MHLRDGKVVEVWAVPEACAAVTIWYDRKGLDRLRPEVIEYANSSVQAYHNRSCNGTYLMPAGGGVPKTKRARIIWLKLGLFCSAARAYAVCDWHWSRPRQWGSNE